MISAVSSSPAVVDARQEAAPKAQPKVAATVEHAPDSVSLSAKAKAGDADGDGH